MAVEPNSENRNRIARAFVAARRGGEPLIAYPGDIPDGLADAYAVQDIALKLTEGAVRGWKVGRINPPIDGIDRLAGPIFHVVEESISPVAMPVIAGGFGAAEAEFLLRIGRAPDPAKHHYTLAEARALIDAVHVGIEIASSPFPGINDHGAAVTISDFGNNNGLVIGATAEGWQESDITGWPVELYINDARIGAAKAETMLDGPVAPIGWSRIIRHCETWAFALGKFLIDPIWWLFLFWTPDFLGKTYHLDLKSFGPPLVVIYVISDLGSVAGGWSSSTLMKRGPSANAARKLTMLACAILVMPIFTAQYISHLWLAVGVVGLATAAHQAFSANLYTLPSDMFPRAAVGSVIGIGGTAGAIGGMMMAKFTGYILETTGSYTPIFAVAGSTYLIAVVVIHILSPRLARVDA